MGKFVDRTGLRYGELVVLRRDISKPSAAEGRRVYWLCQCSCGSIRSITGHALHAGTVKSCGCKHYEWIGEKKTTHGQSCRVGRPRPRTYYTWQSAKARCYNRASRQYKVYGARGITMCDRWRNSFQAFLDDMGERPPGKTLDRIDGNKGYSPDNCRWATPKEQTTNSASSHRIEWKGRTMTLQEIAEMEKIPRTSLNKRYLKLKNISEAVAVTKRLLRWPPT